MTPTLILLVRCSALLHAQLEYGLLRSGADPDVCRHRDDHRAFYRRGRCLRQLSLPLPTGATGPIPGVGDSACRYKSFSSSPSRGYLRSVSSHAAPSPLLVRSARGSFACEP